MDKKAKSFSQRLSGSVRKHSGNSFRGSPDAAVAESGELHDFVVHPAPDFVSLHPGYQLTMSFRAKRGIFVGSDIIDNLAKSPDCPIVISTSGRNLKSIQQLK